MPTMTEVPLHDPMCAAWERYKHSNDFENSKRWAIFPQHVDGSLWAAFCEGYKAAKDAL